MSDLATPDLSELNVHFQVNQVNHAVD